jgi:tetratricopeptide (TPR) repeat protein
MSKAARFCGLLGALTAMVAAVAFAGAQARLRGKVVDSAGNPIPTAAIVVTCDDMDSFEKSVEVREDGAFSFVILDATRNYRFHVEAPDFISYEQPFKVPAGSTDNNFTFELKTTQEMMAAEQVKFLEQPGYKELDEGRELLEQGDTEGAIAKFEAAVAAVDDLVQGWTALAELKFRAADYEAALANARRCIELDDESVKCLAVAANSCRELGDTKSQEEYLSLYQELNPDDPATLFNQAAEFLNKMDDEHARPLLEGCLEADPGFEQCLFEYGMLLLRSGDFEGAKEHLGKYLEVAPDGPEAGTVQETLKYL